MGRVELLLDDGIGGSISLEYLAGLVDADGSLGIQKRKPSKKERTVNPTYRAVMVVSNTYTPIIEELVEQFGGFMTTMKPRKDGHKACHSWVLEGRLLEPLLTRLVVYLRIKAKQANILLAMRNLVQPSRGQGVALDVSIVEQREALYQEIRGLNAGGKGRKGIY